MKLPLSSKESRDALIVFFCQGAVHLSFRHIGVGWISGKLSFMSQIMKTFKQLNQPRHNHRNYTVGI